MKFACRYVESGTGMNNKHTYTLYTKHLYLLKLQTWQLCKTLKSYLAIRGTVEVEIMYR